jgi:hypothetical protein
MPVISHPAADLYTSVRVKLSLRQSDVDLIDYSAMDDGRSRASMIAHLLRELCGAAKRGSEEHPAVLHVWTYHGGIAVEQR